MPSLTACSSLDLPREWLLRIALFVHHIGAEAVNILGKESPCRGAAREDVRVRFYPRWIIVSAGVNDLKSGKPLQGYAEASAASWAEVVVQQSSVIWRAIRVRAGRGTFEAYGLSKKNQFDSECATGGTLAERAMTNRDLYRRSHGPKSYCAAQASALVKLFALAAIIHCSPPASQPECRPTAGVTTTSSNVRVGSFASVWSRTDDFRSTPINRHRYRASACLNAP